MKWLVGVLLLVNVILLGIFRLGMNGHAGSEPVTGHEPIAPEKIKILTPAELSALPKKNEPANPSLQPQFSPTSSAAEPQPVAASCYEWGSFASVEAVRAKATLDKLGLEAIPKQIVPHDAIRYWVYIPPRRSQEDAQTKVDELKALGVEESYIVQEPVWRYAISLGVFKDEALANRFLEGLRSRGVKSAVKDRRHHEGGQTSYTIRNVSLSQADEFGKLQPEFPGSELKQVSCQ